MRFGPRKDVVLSGARCLFEHHEIAFFAGKLVHHDGVRAARYGRTSEYPHALACADGARVGNSGSALGDQVQLRARCGRVGGAQCKPVANGAIERRIVAVGNNAFGKDAAQWGGRGDA